MLFRQDLISSKDVRVPVHQALKRVPDDRLVVICTKLEREEMVRRTPGLYYSTLYRANFITCERCENASNFHPRGFTRTRTGWLCNVCLEGMARPQQAQTLGRKRETVEVRRLPWPLDTEDSAGELWRKGLACWRGDSAAVPLSSLRVVNDGH